MNTNYKNPQLAFAKMNFYNIMTRLTSLSMTKVIALCALLVVSISMDAQTRLIGERSVYTQSVSYTHLTLPTKA